MISSKY